jgi:hypothetical protein
MGILNCFRGLLCLELDSNGLSIAYLAQLGSGSRVKELTIQGGAPLRDDGIVDRELLSSGLIVVLGAAVTVLGWRYRVGTLVHMGAGFIPVVLGCLLVLTGALIGITSWRATEKERRNRSAFQWRAWICILGAVFVFAVVGTYGGLVPASFTSVFVAALADRQNSARDAFVLAVFVAGAGYLIFGLGLKLQFPAFAWG